MTATAIGVAVVGERSFEAIGTRNTVLSSDPTVTEKAVRVARDMVADLDRVASRFRPDSELMSITRAAESRPVTVQVSPLLADCVAAALRAAQLSGGLVDPTVGRAVEASGYDADLDVVKARQARPRAGRRTLRDALDGERPAAVVAGWRQVRLEASTRMLTLPRGCLLDLGSSAKAHTADRVAQRLADLLPGGFLVNLGGDIAVSGQLPPTGWRIGLADAAGRTRQVVVSRGQAMATSSTQRRTWVAHGARQHHIVDPRTARPAPVVWADVTCAGATALEANAASTAAVVLGARAPEWLAGHGIPARLDPVDGAPVLTPGWPEPEVTS